LSYSLGNRSAIQYPDGMSGKPQIRRIWWSAGRNQSEGHKAREQTRAQMRDIVSFDVSFRLGNASRDDRVPGPKGLVPRLKAGASWRPKRFANPIRRFSKQDERHGRR